MRRFPSDGPDDYSCCCFIHIIENTIFANSQFPDWFLLLPRRNQPDQNLPITSLPSRFIPQLSFDPIEELPTAVGAHARKIINYARRITDLVQGASPYHSPPNLKHPPILGIDPFVEAVPHGLLIHGLEENFANGLRAVFAKLFLDVHLVII